LDSIFEELYKEFLDECWGASYMHTNDPVGWKRWYKERLFKLCGDYKRRKEVS